MYTGEKRGRNERALTSSLSISFFLSFYLLCCSLALISFIYSVCKYVYTNIVYEYLDSYTMSIMILKIVIYIQVSSFQDINDNIDLWITVIMKIENIDNERE